MLGLRNTRGGVRYDTDGRMQEAQGAKRVGRLGRFGRAVRDGRDGQVHTMGGAPDTIDPEWASQNPDAAHAKLIETQREDFVSRYRPLEQEAIAEFMKPPEEAAQRAGLAAGSQFGNAAGISQRELGRRGAQMTGDQHRAMTEGLGLAQARGVGTAENIMRREVRDRNVNGLGQMISIGKDIYGGTNRDMGSASQMATGRSDAHKGARQAHTQSMVSTGLGLGALMFTV